MGEINRAGQTLPAMFAGYCAFLQIYATQPLLPLLTDVFHAGKVAVSLTLTVGSLGVALAAPFAGALADRIGRKRVIVWSAFLLAASAAVIAASTTLFQLVFWRFWQGVFTSGIFSVTVAYINDEWRDRGAGKAVSAYVSGTVLGGFSSRMISGLVASRFSWHWVFIVLGAMNLAGAVLISMWLPRETRFQPHRIGAREWLAAARSHLRNPRLLATYLVGFCALFSLVGTFTYVTFYLAAPPFRLKTASLGSIFFVYLVGAAMTPIAGRAVDRFGHRETLAASMATSVAGMGLTLIPSVGAVAAGLALCCAGVFSAQTAANSFIGLAARDNRALAVGLYATFYYCGGSAGAAAPGWFYSLGGWPACAASIAAVQVATVLIALFFWEPLRDSNGA